MNENSTKKVYDPEVLPPEKEGRSFKPADERNRFIQKYGSLLAGLLIDLLDLASFGAHGLRVGLIAGGLLGFWLCYIHKVPIWKSLLWGLAAGIYCAFPFTERLPLATLLGGYLSFKGKK
ncbi:MAG: hypothetical protein GKR87_02055 [Kiritimatiellae bacterium]|nr:hypothetical protein [Kiritimatiellia bacterium]